MTKHSNVWDYGSHFYLNHHNPNIIQKSKVSSEAQGSILTVIPCIIKNKLYASNYTVSQRKYPYFKGEDQTETVLKPSKANIKSYSSMFSVWCSDGSSGPTTHIVSLRLTLLQAYNFLLANIPGSWHLQHLWVSLATKVELRSSIQ